jgi:hypothetical protein
MNVSFFDRKNENILLQCTEAVFQILGSSYFFNMQPYSSFTSSFLQTTMEELTFLLFFVLTSDSVPIPLFLLPLVNHMPKEQLQEELIEIVHHAIELYKATFDTNHETTKHEIKTMEEIQNQIQFLQSFPQPAQRTHAWYVFRQSLIAASEMYKVFRSDASRNELIVKKCQEIEKKNELVDAEAEAEAEEVEGTNDNDTKSIQLVSASASASASASLLLSSSTNRKHVNVESPMHWGQKYEPLSVLFYEKYFQTTIGEFGGLRHPVFPFIGASPDGINISPSSSLFGRLLEIKNVVSREITGVPKEEYWVQMQTQMEVCDLGECDFLETKFEELDSFEAFQNEQQTKKNSIPNTNSTTTTLFTKGTKRTLPKKIINDAAAIIDLPIFGRTVYFIKTESDSYTPVYMYCPLHLTTEEECMQWTESTIAENQHYTFIKVIFWKLTVFNCVLVKRDKEWFRSHVAEIETVWRIIEEERLSGKYVYRKPVPRPRKRKIDSSLSSSCFLSVKKK